jgi:hypothetical protein
MVDRCPRCSSWMPRATPGQHAALQMLLEDVALQQDWPVGSGKLHGPAKWWELLAAAYDRTQKNAVELLPAIDGVGFDGNGLDFVRGPRRRRRLNIAEIGEIIEFIRAWAIAERGLQLARATSEGGGLSFFDPTETCTATTGTVIVTSYESTASPIIRRMRAERMIGVLIALGATDTTSTLAEEMRACVQSMRDFSDLLKRRPPREPQPAPFGWRDPVAFIETTRRRPIVILACSHRAARRDIRRAHRSRWLSELRS